MCFNAPQGTPAAKQAQGYRFMAAMLQNKNGNPAPLSGLRANFQANHGGQTVRQVMQARRAPAGTGG